MVCACEDVTATDVHAALAHGHDDLESLKRYTGLATGICQGRNCLARAAGLLHAHTQITPRPISARPPLWPTTLAALAAAGELPPIYPGSEAPALTPSPPPPRPPATMAALPTSVDVVVIGGGIMGLALAYHLAERRLAVAVLEQSYLNAGASGRNGGGIREQWSTEENILLMKESIARCRELAQELGINIWLRQGGYLFVTRTRERLQAMAENIALQNRLGVPSRLVKPAEIARVVHGLTTTDLAGGAYNPEDGVIFPWPFVWGYAEGARRLGAHVATFTPARAIDVEGGRVTGVHTPRGRLACGLVVNAAAAWANEVAALAGVTLPNRPQRHEILVTESLRPFLDPLVSEVGTGLYFSQSLRGEIVAGMGDPEQPPGLELRTSLRFLTRIARALVHRLPSLSGVKVLRQWAGCYDLTPDDHPLIGEVNEVKGFYQLHGFVGHGFMMAPVVCRLVADEIASGRTHAFLAANRPSRFAAGALRRRETMIIG